ncbi:hypothetical protein GGQ80_003304 [Sphingomonas jinjuensis]|uniref:Uncharacterized protein n=1 Tax=Sphingomonas jinjuensis TaxID=535907 RepID=A0A840FI57_9SPHN|nr:hypothetical protein [Sphingomonas jinjuensis]MBB4155384.1 hypothetical protein [Sphingomonas jinjuensis]
MIAVMLPSVKRMERKIVPVVTDTKWAPVANVARMIDKIFESVGRTVVASPGQGG